MLIGVLGDICDENNYHSTNTTLNKAQLFKMSRFGVGAWILLTAPQTEIRILWRVKNTLFLNAMSIVYLTEIIISGHCFVTNLVLALETLRIAKGYITTIQHTTHINGVTKDSVS